MLLFYTFYWFHSPYSGSFVLFNLLHVGVFFFILLSSAAFFFNFSKNSFRNTIRVSYGLGPVHDRRSAIFDLGPNCLQRLSTDYKSYR